MAKGQNTPPSRWGEPEPKRPSPGRAAWRRSRWGQTEGNEIAPAKAAPPVPSGPMPADGQRQNPAEPQEPLLLQAAIKPETAPFPVPRQQEDKAAGDARQLRSYAWLKSLEGTEDNKAGIHRPARRSRLPPRKLVISVLIVVLCLLLVAAVLLVSIPSLRERALALLPHRAAPSPTANADLGSLIARSNVPNSTLSLNGKTYSLVSQDQTGWSVQVDALAPGSYALTISAPHYLPASGEVAIQARQEQAVSAILTVDPAFLMSMLSSGQNQISGPTLADPVAAGAQYTGASTAAAPLKVTIDYRVESLVNPPATSVLDIGQNSPPMAAPLSGIVAPDILFTNAASGAVVSEYHPAALPSAHFLVALNVTIDAAGKASFALGNPAVLTATSASGAAVTIPGGVTPDLALLFGLVGLSLEQGTASGTFTCIGQIDALTHPNAPPNPEDGLLLGMSGNNAHYFYRWGQFWTTNIFAHALTPGLPQANDATLVTAQNLIDARTQGLHTGCAS